MRGDGILAVAGGAGSDGEDAVATQGRRDGGDAAFGYLRSVATQFSRGSPVVRENDEGQPIASLDG